MTIPQSVNNVLSAVVSVMVDAEEMFVESAATYRASLSIQVVQVLISSPNEDTRATQGGSVTSAILSASWATSSRGACAYVAIIA